MAEEDSAYKKAGVNISEGEHAARLIKPIIKSTWNKRVVSEMEGMFSTGYRTDQGCGEFIGHGLIPIANLDKLEEILINGLENLQQNNKTPLFLMDYLAFGKLKAEDAESLVKRIKYASAEANLASKGTPIPIIGGEIAELPGVLKINGVEAVIAVTYQTRFATGHKLSEMRGGIITGSFDSVGTKPKLGMMVGIMENLFLDMAGHAVGDICVQGAEPIGMGIYVGHSPSFAWEEMGHIAYNSIEILSKLNLFDYTTEQKHVYVDNQLDIVGSIIGVVDEEKLITGKNINVGDSLYGLKSFGVNTNGYSLIRKLVDEGWIDVNEKIPGLNRTAGNALMQPHENYMKDIIDMRETLGDKLKGIAHITGGGIKANTDRLLPDGTEALIENLPENPVFEYIQDMGSLTEEDMNGTFNRGIGLVFVVDESWNKPLSSKYMKIGHVVESGGE